MRSRQLSVVGSTLALLFIVSSHSIGGDNKGSKLVLAEKGTPAATDSLNKTNQETLLIEPAAYRNVWGLDILISNDGFGLGTFYRREFSENLHGFISFSISESKDDREVDRYDPYTQVTFVPGKLNRFLVLPLMFGVQHRMFKEDITETFRPYVNAAIGPTMIFAAPFVDFVPTALGIQTQQIEFFKSLGKGQAHYTAAGYIGFGANFGTDRSNIFGVNFRYYFTYLFGDGLPSLYTSSLSGVQVSSTKKDFGGFFITLNVGMAY
jgi:hypothetical protein